MRKSLIVILLGLFFATNAQPPGRFLGKWGGDGDDIGYSVKQTLDGQYIIAGSSSSYGTHGNTDVYLTKLDTMGFVIWHKFYGGTSNEVGKSVIQLPDSGYVIAGFTNSYGAGGYDAIIIKVDKNGDMLWQRTFGGSDWDFASDLVFASDGNLFVVGNTSSFGSGKKDGFVLKYDVSGNLLLQKFVGGAENDELQSIINTNDNFLATVGYTESRGEINGDGYFLKLNLNADTIFTTTFGGPYKDYACDLVQKDAGQGDAYYLGGAMTPSANAKTHSYMYRISPTGTFLSAADEFRNADNEEFISVANSKHHSYLTAFVRSTIVGGKSMQEEIFIAYVTGFSFLVNDGGYFDHEYVYSVEATRDKGYITVGSTDGYGSVGKDILFIKRDSAVVNYETITSIPLLTLRQSPIISYQDESIIIDPNRDDLEQIEICDMMGNKIFNQITSQKQYRIDISTYPHSIYIVTIKYKNGGIYSEKFIH